MAWRLFVAGGQQTTNTMKPRHARIRRAVLCYTFNGLHFRPNESDDKTHRAGAPHPDLLHVCRERKTSANMYVPSECLHWIHTAQPNVSCFFFAVTREEQTLRIAHPKTATYSTILPKTFVVLGIFTKRVCTKFLYVGIYISSMNRKLYFLCLLNKHSSGWWLSLNKTSCRSNRRNFRHRVSLLRAMHL